jgi:hypothetical protein
MKYIKLFENFEEGRKYDVIDLFAMSSTEVENAFFKEITKSKPDYENIDVFIESGRVDFQTKNEEGNTAFTVAFNNPGMIEYLVNNTDLINIDDIKSFIQFDDEDDDEYFDNPEERLSNHISKIEKIWGAIKDKPELKALLSQLKDLTYNEDDDTFTLTLENLKDLSVLWYDGTLSTDTIEKILSEDYYGDELYYGDSRYYYGNEMEYLTEKEYTIIRDILKKHKDDIENYEELELEDDKELERYIEKSDDDIAKDIKGCLIRARNQLEEYGYYDELLSSVMSESVKWLTGRKYNKNSDFKYSDGGYKLEGIKIDLVIGALSMIWGDKTFTFLERISHFITDDDGDEYGKIEAEFAHMEYWYPSIKSEDFIEQFTNELDWNIN